MTCDVPTRPTVGSKNKSLMVRCSVNKDDYLQVRLLEGVRANHSSGMGVRECDNLRLSRMWLMR